MTYNFFESQKSLPEPAFSSFGSWVWSSRNQQIQRFQPKPEEPIGPWPALAGLDRAWPAISGSQQIQRRQPTQEEPGSHMAGHGRHWPAMDGHGWPWPVIMASHGRPWPANSLWPAIIWPAVLPAMMAGLDRAWPALYCFVFALRCIALHCVALLGFAC